MVVREIATRPLTQDLLSHEVRGSGVPPAPAPHYPPAPCPLSPSGSSARVLGWSGWGAQEANFCVCSSPSLRFLSHLQDCYILDQGGLKIYVWKGKNANAQEKKEAMNQALVGLGVKEENLEEEQRRPPSREKAVGANGQGWHWASLSSGGSSWRCSAPQGGNHPATPRIVTKREPPQELHLDLGSEKGGRNGGRPPYKKQGGSACG